MAAAEEVAAAQCAAAARVRQDLAKAQRALDQANAEAAAAATASASATAGLEQVGSRWLEG